MIKDNIIYLFNQEFNPICRDAGKPYAESLGLKYNYLPTWKDYINKGYNLIVDTGWKTEESLKVLLDILEHGCPRNIVFRVVDDNPKTYSEFDKQFISENRLSEFELISPYLHVHNRYVPHCRQKKLSISIE